MEIKLYVREFRSDSVVETFVGEYVPSTYFPYPMINALKIAQFRDEDFILCPVYDRVSPKDFQIGMTGTVEKDEKNIHTVFRESTVE